VRRLAPLTLASGADSEKLTILTHIAEIWHLRQRELAGQVVELDYPSPRRKGGTFFYGYAPPTSGRLVIRFKTGNFMDGLH
jgi:hypothetical protein